MSWFHDDPDDNVYECHHKTHTQCYGWGDPHIVTFDNAKSDVYGIAQYTFAEFNGTDDRPKFTFLMNTKPLGRVSMIKVMYFKFPRKSGELVEIETFNDGKANFYTKSEGWKTLHTQKTPDFEYRKIGRKSEIKTWFGIEAEHISHKYLIKVPGFYSKDLYGLCMNKNGDLTDDYMKKDGTILPVPPQGGYKRTWQEYESATSWITGSVDLRGCLQYEEGDEEITDDLEVGDPGPDADEDLSCDDKIKDQVEEECTTMFTGSWLKECTDVVDPSQTIQDCFLDYCADKTEETKIGIMQKFIDDCSEKLEEDHKILCQWPVLSGLVEPTCGTNEVWKGCANPCSDITDCDGAASCTGKEKKKPLCVCKPGFVMSDGECIKTEDCPAGDDDFTNWSDWTSCTKSCGRGTKLRSRICLSKKCSGSVEDVSDCNTCTCVGQTLRTYLTPDNLAEYKLVSVIWDGMDDIFIQGEGSNDFVISLSKQNEADRYEIHLGTSQGTSSKIIPPTGSVDATLTHTTSDLQKVHFQFCQTYIFLFLNLQIVVKEI